MKKYHILYQSICTTAQADLAKNISKKIGHETKDSAIVLHDEIHECIFSKELDFREIASKKNWYAKKAIELDLSLGVDDNDLKELKYYVMETYNMFCRQYGFVANINSFERIWIQGISFWKAYIEKNKIDLVIFFEIPHEGHDYILYQVCKFLKIETRIFVLSIDCNRCYIAKFLGEENKYFKTCYEKLTAIYKELPEEEIVIHGSYNKFYSRMQKDDSEKKPFYMEAKYVRWEYIRRFGYKYVDAFETRNKSRFFRYLLGQFIYIDKKISSGNITIKCFELFNKEYKKTKELNAYYMSMAEEPDYEKKYIYLPLHFQPEGTSNPLGGDYYNQILTVRLLDKVLSNDCLIYVKEHPKQTSIGREKAFYEELLLCKKVRLITKNASTYDLVRNSVAVSTLTGTVAFESAFLDKPVLVWGDWIIKYLPNAFTIKTEQDLKNAITSITNAERVVSYRKDLKIFFKALDETEAKRVSIDSVIDDDSVKSSLEFLLKSFNK